MNEPVGETLVIQQSRWKTALFLLLSIVFVIGGIWMINDPDGSGRRSAEYLHFWGWVTVLFFGLGFFALIGRLIRPSQLLLSPQGFTIRHFLRQDHFPWGSVASFHVWSHRGAKMPGWRLHDDSPEFGVGARISRGLGTDGSMGGGWDRSPEAIVALLQAWKDRHAPEPVDTPGGGGTGGSAIPHW